MDVSQVDWLWRLVEVISVMVMPMATCYFGYRRGWADAKEQSFRKSRAHHKNKLWY